MAPPNTKSGRDWSQTCYTSCREEPKYICHYFHKRRIHHVEPPLPSKHHLVNFILLFLCCKMRLHISAVNKTQLYGDLTIETFKMLFNKCTSQTKHQLRQPMKLTPENTEISAIFGNFTVPWLWSRGTSNFKISYIVLSYSSLLPVSKEYDESSYVFQKI